jgi:hypothetical protein
MTLCHPEWHKGSWATSIVAETWCNGCSSMMPRPQLHSVGQPQMCACRPDAANCCAKVRPVCSTWCGRGQAPADGSHPCSWAHTHTYMSHAAPPNWHSASTAPCCPWMPPLAACIPPLPTTRRPGLEATQKEACHTSVSHQTEAAAGERVQRAMRGCNRCPPCEARPDNPTNASQHGGLHSTANTLHALVMCQRHTRGQLAYPTSTWRRGQAKLCIT